MDVSTQNEIENLPDKKGRLSTSSLVILLLLSLLLAFAYDGTSISPTSMVRYISSQVENPFGTLSRHKCFKAIPSAPSEICVFENLYIIDKSLRYLTDKEESVDEPLVHSGVPKYVTNNWLSSKPRMMITTEFEQLEKEDFSSSIMDVPIFVYQRLNPYNIHHHLLDDMSTVYTLLTHFHKLTLTSIGQPMDIQLAFLDDAESSSGPGGSMSSTLYDKGWEVISNQPAHLYSTILRASEKTSMIRKLLVGTSGMCPHQRHCIAELPPGALLSFKHHLNAFFGIVSQLPSSPTALVIRRSKDRLMQNYDAVKDGLTSKGFNTQIVGPLSKYTLQEQLSVLSNASLYVFVAGAELGPILYAMPDRASLCEIFPYLTAEDVPFWYGIPLGLGIAIHEDAPTDPANYRCSMPSDQIGVFFTKLYRADVLEVNVTRLLESIDKRLDNFSQYETPKCAVM
jgi:hypothetical protein